AGLSASVLLLLSCVPVTAAEAAKKLPPAEPISISIDATGAPAKILRARLSIPAKPGPLTLYYPKWIPGEHAPTGPIGALPGLTLAAGGKTISWQRDSADMYAFHCDVPAGASAVVVELELLSPTSAEGFSSGSSTTEKLLDLSWNQLLLYPA